MNQNAAPRVLLIRLSAIGDVVVTTPVTRAIRESLPESYVAWVVEPKAAAVLKGNPYLDQLILWDRQARRSAAGQVSAYRELAAELRALRFDAAIDFQGLLRSGLVARLSGARMRIGNDRCKEPAHLFYTHRIARPRHTTSSRQRCLDLLQPLGIRTEDRRGVVAFSEDDRQAARAALAEAGAPAGQPVAALAPVTTWPHKHWLDDRWALVADRLREEQGFFPAFLGARADTAKIRQIQGRMTGPAANLCGETTLSQAAALVAEAGVVVAVDTGLLHIAAAVGAPLVGVCGASYWPGFQDYDNFRLVREPFPCSPCLHHPICRYVDCMQAIVPRTVLEACRQVTSGRGLAVL